MNETADLLSPSLDDFVALARAALADLPPEIREAAGELVIHVDDFADDATLEALGIDDAFELSGLYQGVDRMNRGVLGPAPEASRVHLYRRPILDEWAERGDLTLGELVTHVLMPTRSATTWASATPTSTALQAGD